MMQRLETSKVKSFNSFCNTFFLFIPQKKMYYEYRNRMFYMIEMSFKYLLDVPSWTVLPRDVFRNPIKSLRWGIFCEESQRFLAVNYFCKRAPSQMFKWALNRLWATMSEAYLELSQMSMVEHFCKNSNIQPLTIFAKNLHHRDSVGF